jgi:hypothetical protein
MIKIIEYSGWILAAEGSQNPTAIESKSGPSLSYPRTR